MIEKLDKSYSNVLAFRATGKLTDEDYKRVLVPAMQDRVRESDRIRVMLEFDEEFSGWELGAMWDDAKFGLKFRQNFEKMAIVGAPRWVEWGAELGGRLMRCELRTFPAEEARQAWEWITS